MKLSITEASTLYIADTRNGKGIFVKETVVPGSILFQVKGTKLTCNEDEDIDEETRSNTFRFDPEYYLSPKGKIADYLNHSCNPNARVIKRNDKLFVASIKQIPKGREILIDYSTIIASDDSWTMRCNCGSARCRGVVKKFRSLPKEIRDRYIQKEIVPSYIRAL